MTHMNIFQSFAVVIFLLLANRYAHVNPHVNFNSITPNNTHQLLVIDINS